ncbi:MAG: hypothetical protein VXW76_05055 [Actinomycetota bacterium]|nr:hypothetical protein [Actinomycetota bacterium]
MFDSRIGLDFDEFEGDVNVGDLLEIKHGMMLIEPVDPVMVLEADNTQGIYKIMYLRNNYVIGCGRMEIGKVISKAAAQHVSAR